MPAVFKSPSTDRCKNGDWDWKVTLVDQVLFVVDCPPGHTKNAADGKPRWLKTFAVARPKGLGQP